MMTKVKQVRITKNMLRNWNDFFPSYWSLYTWAESYQWVMTDELFWRYYFSGCLESIRIIVIIHSTKEPRSGKSAVLSKTLNTILAQPKGIPLTREKTTRVSNIDSCALLFHKSMENMIKCLRRDLLILWKEKRKKKNWFCHHMKIFYALP